MRRRNVNLREKWKQDDVAKEMLTSCADDAASKAAKEVLAQMANDAEKRVQRLADRFASDSDVGGTFGRRCEGDLRVLAWENDKLGSKDAKSVGHIRAEMERQNRAAETWVQSRYDYYGRAPYLDECPG